MRSFNNTEKKYIHWMNSSKTGRSIVDLLDNKLKKTILTIDKTKKSAEFKFEIADAVPDEKESEWIVGAIGELQYEIVIFAHLLEYLESERLLISYIAHQPLENVVSFGQGAVNLQAVSYSFPDQMAIDLLIKYIDKRLIPAPDLIGLEQDAFLTTEEKRFKKSHFATWAAIVVSLCLGLWGIYKDTSNKSDELLRHDLTKELHSMSDSISNRLRLIQNEVSRRDSLTMLLPKPTSKIIKKH